MAAQLGLAVTACASLREVSVASPRGFNDSDMIARHREQLEEIADLYRGETVLVVGHRTILGLVVPTLARNVSPRWARDHDLAATETAELDRDADGWVLRRWGTQRLEV